MGNYFMGDDQVAGYVDAIANAMQVGAAAEASGLLSNLYGAGHPPELIARIQNAVLTRVSPLVAQASAASGAWQFGEDLLAPNQVAFLDSGDVLVAADTDTGTFTITPSAEYCITGVYVSRVMTENFGLKQFSVANFSILSLGFSTTGNGVNPCLTLSCWDPGQIDRRPLPFLGRKFAANTNIIVVAHNIKAASARFQMAIGLRLNVGCSPGQLIEIADHVPGYVGGRPRIPRPMLPQGNFSPVPIPR